MDMHDETVNFNGAEINLSHEFHEARKMMGMKSTDLSQLQTTVSHVYLVIPKDSEWNQHYITLIHEIEHRQTMIFNLQLDALVG